MRRKRGVNVKKRNKTQSSEMMFFCPLGHYEYIDNRGRRERANGLASEGGEGAGTRGASLTGSAPSSEVQEEQV